MKKTFQIGLLSILMLGMNSCEKTPTNPTDSIDVNTDFFVEGKGLRKIWGMESSVSGLGAFAITHLTATPEGKIHTVFAYTRSGVNGGSNNDFRYRKLIDITTGDTSVMSSPPPPTVISSYQEDYGGILMVPYTQFLGYDSPGGTIVGDAPWMPFPGIEAYGRKIYKNNQALASYTYHNVLTNAMETYVSLHTQSVNTNYLYKPTTPLYGASIDMTESGQALLFTAGDPNLQVIDFGTKSVIASVPLGLFNSGYNYNKSNNLIEVRTKRSQDNTKIIGLVHDANFKTVSTFIYTIATQTLKLKVNKAASPNSSFLSSANTTFDEDGNIYYVSQNNSAEIKIITPSGDAIFRSGFLKDGVVLCVKSVGKDLFVAVGTNGNNYYSDSRGRGKLLITQVQ